jgi:hypothetical protein
MQILLAVPCAAAGVSATLVFTASGRDEAPREGWRWGVERRIIMDGTV